jgi:hypothetical protein
MSGCGITRIYPNAMGPSFESPASRWDRRSASSVRRAWAWWSGGRSREHTLRELPGRNRPRIRQLRPPSEPFEMVRSKLYLAAAKLGTVVSKLHPAVSKLRRTVRNLSCGGSKLGSGASKLWFTDRGLAPWNASFRTPTRSFERPVRSFHQVDRNGVLASGRVEFPAADPVPFVGDFLPLITLLPRRNPQWHAFPKPNPRSLRSHRW